MIFYKMKFDQMCVNPVIDIRYLFHCELCTLVCSIYFLYLIQQGGAEFIYRVYFYCSFK